MKTVVVRLAKHSYPILVGEGLLRSAGALLRRKGFDNPPIVVTNRTVLDLHGKPLLRSLQDSFENVEVIIIGDGERYKNHATLLQIYRKMLHAHANRRSWILAFGGGVVGDIAGFAAATFMRGIPFVMVPTTLLAQVDSAIGGKVAVNVPEGKNLVGAFHQPEAVLSDISVLRTLPSRELASGLYEVLKCGAIRSRALLDYLRRNLSRILGGRSDALQHIVWKAASIKAEVVAADEKENGLRMILNYGHTIGHAFEAATDYRRFKHGEAVAWGMIAASAYGQQLGFMGGKESESLIRLIRSIGPLPPLRGISPERVWDALVRDKKFLKGDIRMVFLRKLGEAEIGSGLDSASLRAFLTSFLAREGV